MGDAKETFTVRVGGYSRVFPVANIRQATLSMLLACHDTWPDLPGGQARQPLRHTLLLVTWFTPDQPTTSYQVHFGSSEACNAARAQVLKDADRMKNEKVTLGQQTGLPPQMAGLASPSVSAVCVQQ